MQADVFKPVPIISQITPLGVSEAPLLNAQIFYWYTMVLGRFLKGQKTYFGTGMANGRSGILN